MGGGPWDRDGHVDRRAARHRDRPLLAWVYLIDPILDDATLTGGKLVSIAYPVGDVLLVSFAARFVMGTSWTSRRSGSWWSASA